MGKQVVQVKLVPTPGQSRALVATLRGVDEAANRTSGVAFARGVPREKVRAGLQIKAAKSAKKQLKARASREARAVKDSDHRIAKQLVTSAERTARGIALEDLKGVRDRVRLPAAQRGGLNAWSFHQLRAFITYKAERAGVPVAVVDARNTSPRCPSCGHTAKTNRPTRDYSACVACGLAGSADQVAATDIRDRACMTRVFVNTPDVADTLQPAADTSGKPQTSVRGSRPHNPAARAS